MKAEDIKPNTVVKVKMASGDVRSGRFVRLTDDGAFSVRLYKQGARPPKLNASATTVDPADVVEIGGKPYKSTRRRPKSTASNPKRTTRKTSGSRARKTSGGRARKTGGGRARSSGSGRRKATRTRSNPSMAFPSGCSLGDYVVLCGDADGMAAPKVFSRKKDALEYAEGKDAAGKKVLVADIIAHGD